MRRVARVPEVRAEPNAALASREEVRADIGCETRLPVPLPVDPPRCLTAVGTDPASAIGSPPAAGAIPHTMQ